MQDDMSQDEIDAVLKNAMGGQDSAPAGVDEVAAEEVPTQPVQDPVDTAQATVGTAQVPPTMAEEVAAEPATNFAEASEEYTTGTSAGIGNIDFLMDVPLDISVELGRAKMPIRDMLQLRPGSVIELDKLIGEPVDLLVNNRLIARGEVVVFDENFGIRITDIIKPEDRVRMLG
jgi:flagellar motor switch protein FliN/FliY